MYYIFAKWKFIRPMKQNYCTARYFSLGYPRMDLATFRIFDDPIWRTLEDLALVQSLHDVCLIVKLFHLECRIFSILVTWLIFTISKWGVLNANNPYLQLRAKLNYKGRSSKGPLYTSPGWFSTRVSNSQPGLARVIFRATDWSRVYFWRLYPI
jgi:hypothetical protein